MYVDFGNVEWVPEMSCRQLQKKFVGLPIQAVEVFLPIKSLPKGEDWSEETLYD